MGERKRRETEERKVRDQLSFVKMYIFMYTLELMTAREKKSVEKNHMQTLNVRRWFWLTDL